MKTKKMEDTDPQNSSDQYLEDMFLKFMFDPKTTVVKKQIGIRRNMFH